MVEGSAWGKGELVQSHAFTEPAKDDWDPEGRPSQVPILPVLLSAEPSSPYAFQPQLLACRLALFSMKPVDLPKISEVLRACGSQSLLQITETVLLKSQLRGYEYRGRTDIAVLHHRAEGRLLLTDRNGYYHDLLASLQLACGSV